MRILVVDDEKNIANTLAMILERAGHHASAVYDGTAALERLNGFAPDCVICDVVMPGMDGVQVCTKIQSRYPSCHILLFSGQSIANQLIDDARQNGVHWELLAKPVEPVELLAKLASISKAQSSTKITQKAS